MQQFRSHGVTHLVLDLRYNGGGRIEMARKLTRQIAGPATDDQRFVEYVFKDKYQEDNVEIVFEPEPLNPGLDRLAVLVSGSTASAAEMVINGLRPYMPFTLFGEEVTVGKPYVSYDQDLEPCGERMSAFEAEHVDASDVSVAGGLLPDCAASDDLGSPLGFGDGGNVEGMLEKAMDFIAFGTCDTPVIQASRRKGFSTDEPGVGPFPLRGGAVAERP